MRRFLAISLVMGALGTACETDCNSSEPAYTGLATDDAWLALLDGRNDASSEGDVPVFTAPEADSSHVRGAPPTFSWTSPLKLAAATPSRPAGPARRRGPLDAAFDLIIPRAHAHLPPITSDLYLLEIDVPGRACPVSGATTELGFTFASSDWEAIVAGGGERTARLMSAFLSSNIITEGPFLADPLTFTVTDE